MENGTVRSFGEPLVKKTPQLVSLNVGVLISLLKTLSESNPEAEVVLEIEENDRDGTLYHSGDLESVGVFQNKIYLKATLR